MSKRSIILLMRHRHKLLDPIYLNYVCYTFFHFKGQTASIYFGLRRAFDNVLHAVPVHKLYNFRLSEHYVTCFQSYLSSRFSYVRILGKFSSPFSILSGWHKAPRSDVYFVIFLLTLYVPKSVLVNLYCLVMI
jgi:hypothetical protein